MTKDEKTLIVVLATLLGVGWLATRREPQALPERAKCGACNKLVPVFTSPCPHCQAVLDWQAWQELRAPSSL